MVLGTHIFDLMRHLAGDARGASRGSRPPAASAVAGDVREAGEQMRPDPRRPHHRDLRLRRRRGRALRSRTRRRTACEHALRAGDSRHEGRHPPRLRQPARRVPLRRPVLHVRPRQGSRGRRSRRAGVGKPETLDAKAIGNGNVLIVNDLIEAIEKDRQPLGSIYDGRAALEMILAVYESHRLERPGGAAAEEPQAPAGGLVSGFFMLRPGGDPTPDAAQLTQPGCHTQEST